MTHALPVRPHDEVSSSKHRRFALSREAVVPYVLLLPALLIFLVFFVSPFVTLIINSFYDYSRMTGIIEVFTLKNYERVWLDSFYLTVVFRTLVLATVTAAVTLVVGYPVALYLTVASQRARGLIIFFILSPLMVSVIVRTFGWLIILGPNGVIHSAFTAIGIPNMVFLHTDAAVVLGLVNVLMPFVVLAVATALQSIDPAVPLAAASLGASPIRAFLKITLPLSLPGVLAGVVIVFSLSASSFVTPAVLGGTQFKVLATVMYQQAMLLQNWPFAASIAVALVLIVFFALQVQSRALEGGKHRMVFQ